MAASPGRSRGHRIADDQAALRRVAVLAARAAPPGEVFAAVTEEAGRLLGAGHAAMSRYDPDGAVRVVAAWSSTGAAVPPGTRIGVGGRNVHTLVFQTGRPARTDLAEASGTATGVAGELAQRLEGVVTEVTGVLEELREIARGLHPAVLSESGLGPALRALARRSAVPVSVDVQVAGRLPEPVETAAYYVVSEALTNAAKHAHASAAEVEVAAGDGVLQVCVRDDGSGGADFGHGPGLVGLKDRIEALGGRIWLHSQPGAGTVVQIVLPVDDPTAA